ncbi:MAG TPA: sugar ABC transporter substrate-binding protein [Spirochaetia bacterium]|nr:sugar ABC transporter substrate-binding protein [Spirochaetia bacterium]
MKRLIMILCALLVVGLPSSFAMGGTPEKRVYEVAVSLPGSVEFFSVERKGMDKAAAEYGLKLTYADAEWDAGKQLSQVENFAAKKVDLIMLCAADNQALLPAVKVCKEAKIPLITFTNVVGPNPDGTLDGVVSYIGTNEVTIGRLIGKMAEKALGKSAANIVLIEGTPGTPPQRMRTQGFKEIVDAHPNWKIVYSQAIPGWTKEGALAAMEAFLQTGQKVDLVAAHWYGGATAAAQALKEKGYNQNRVVITGYEFSKELAPFIKDGTVDMTANYSIQDTGYKAVQAAAKVLKGEKIPAFIEIVPDIVSKDNVDSVVPEL